MRNPYWHLIKLSWRNAVGRRRILVVTYILLLIANIIILTEPLVIGKVLNTIQLGGDDVFSSTVFWLVVYALVPIGFWAFHGVARIAERKTSYFIEKNYRESLFYKVTQMPMRWHKDHHSGETHDKIEKSANAARNYSEGSFRYMETFMKLVVSLGAIVILLPKYGLLAIVLAAIMFMVMWRFDKVLSKNRMEINRREHQVAQTFFDYISNIKTIVTLRLEKLVNREYSSSIARIFPILKKNIHLNELKWFSNGMLVNITTFLLLLLYIWDGLRADEVFLFGSLVMFHGYIGQFSRSFFNFAWQWEDLVHFSTDAQAVDSITTAYDDLEGKRHYKKKIVDWKNIKAEHIWFAHEDDKKGKMHVDDVSIELNRGEKVALVGASGSGKSTLLTLLRSLEAPKQAKILIDDKPVRDMGILSTISTLIPQEPEIFDNTIEYNISVGIRHKQDEINRAIKLARFASVLKRLPKGLQTDVKERGVNLSGGEKQRLALARGIFAARDSSLILLDESTSSVDMENEMAIYKGLFMHWRRECVVSAIHRLHLLPLFDRIYILADGKVLEHGSFKDLTSRPNGVLRKKWDEYSEELAKLTKNAK